MHHQSAEMKQCIDNLPRLLPGILSGLHERSSIQDA